VLADRYNSWRTWLTTAVALLLVSLVVSRCSRAPTGPTPNAPGTPNVPGPTIPAPTLPVPNVGPEIFTGAGDIAVCGAANQVQGKQEETARLLDTIGGYVFTLGDNAYYSGSHSDYNNCYHRSWGRHLGRTRPSPGNHDYATPGATPYFEYYGQLAGPSGLGYYSFDLGGWHIISLNSNEGEPGANVSVAPGSPQGMWLQQDLAQNRLKCSLAYWHHPLFSSGRNGQHLRMRPFYQMLYDANAEVVLTGHDHLYERFAPQTPDGRLDPQRGIRQFIVGTGGIMPLYEFMAVRPNSEAQNNQDHGVLRLTLSADSYQWEFVTLSGVRDSGGPVACH
jgi:hypothetical protein